MDNKPNQVIDEITQVIYPPAEAVVEQLNTIRAIITPTVKMYQTTEDIHTIQPNLDMIQRAIDYLRGAPMKDELKPAPEDVLNPDITPSAAGVTVQKTFNKYGIYEITIIGVDIEPTISHPELFGELKVPALEMNLTLPVVCGTDYDIQQINPILEHYKDDPSIQQDSHSGKWFKDKTYHMDEDCFSYAFLLGEGRTTAQIVISPNNKEDIIFNITSHIHFKEDENDNSESTLQPDDSGDVKPEGEETNG